MEEFQDLVAHLRDRLTPDDEGKPKRFYDTSVDSLRDFFGRARKLSVLWTPWLLREVKNAEALVKNVSCGDLRQDAELRKVVAAGLAEIESRQPGRTPINPAPAAPKKSPVPAPPPGPWSDGSAVS